MERSSRAVTTGFPAHDVSADKGDDSNAIVEALERSGAQAVIPSRARVKDPWDTDFAL